MHISPTGIWKKLLRLVKDHAAILVPFLFIAMAEAAALLVLFLAPRPPLSIVIAPIIRAFWGEQYLHYPMNFLLLPKLFTYVRYGLSFLTGIFFTGVAISLITQAAQQQPLSWWTGIKKTTRLYLRLFAAFAVTFAVVLGGIKGISYLDSFIGSKLASVLLSFLITGFLQALFIFVMPAIIIENRKVFMAFKRSLAIINRHPFATIALVLVPSVLFLPISWLYIKLPSLLSNFDPEIVLYSLYLRIAVVTVVDFLITASAVLFFLRYREQESLPGAQGPSAGGIPSSAISLLLVIAALPLFVSCGGDYNAEKMLWHANRRHAEVFRNIAKASAPDFAAAVADLKNVIAQNPQWRETPELQFNIGHMYLQRNDFKTGRTELAGIPVNYPKSYETAARAVFAIGASYETEGNWDNALKQYQLLISNYPRTSTGIQIPFYIGERYLRRNMRAESIRAFNNAIDAYQNMIKENPFSQQVPYILNLMIASYGGQSKWEEAAKALEALAAKYPTSPHAPVILYRTANIYRDVLGNQQAAIDMYRRILNEYPSSTIGKNTRFDLGSLTIARGDLAEGHKELQQIIDKYPSDLSLCAQSQFSIAASLGQAGKWDQSLSEFEKLLKNYPDSLQSLQAPLIIARHYKTTGNDELFRSTLKNALSQYDAFAARNAKKKTAPAALESKVKAYVFLEDWQNALKTLNELRSGYPKLPAARMIPLTMASIYADKLKDASAARRLYTEFLEKYPYDQLAGQVRTALYNLDSGASNK